MPDAEKSHCASCGVLPRYALTELGGKLWRPECLPEKTRQEIAHPRPAPPPAAPPPVPAPDHGLTVGDVPREIGFREIEWW